MVPGGGDSVAAGGAAQRQADKRAAAVRHCRAMPRMAETRLTRARRHVSNNRPNPSPRGHTNHTTGPVFWLAVILLGPPSRADAQWRRGRFVRLTAAGAAPECSEAIAPKSPDFPFHSGRQIARRSTRIAARSLAAGRRRRQGGEGWSFNARTRNAPTRAIGRTGNRRKSGRCAGWPARAGRGHEQPHEDGREDEIGHAQSLGKQVLGENEQADCPGEGAENEIAERRQPWIRWLAEGPGQGAQADFPKQLDARLEKQFADDFKEEFER